MTGLAPNARLLSWGVVALGGVLAGTGGFALGRGLSSIWAVPMILLGIVIVGWAAFRTSGKALHGIILAAVAGLAMKSCVSVGKLWLRNGLRSEIENLKPFLERQKKAPDMWDVPTPGILRMAQVRKDLRGDGVIISFGLEDGSSIEFVSNNLYWVQEQKAHCSEEVEPGWYRRYRCHRGP